MKNKIIKNTDWEVKTPTGWSEFGGVVKYSKRQFYEVVTASLKKIEVTKNHAFISRDGEKILCKKCLGKEIKTVDGFEEVISITKTKVGNPYDLIDVKDGNVYYANDILNHNTHLMHEFWMSVIPVVSSSKRSKIFAVSTPNGVGNKFYEIYSHAEKGGSDWKAERIDWWQVPGRTERWKSQMVSALGSEEAFAQEFGNQFSDPSAGAVGGEVIERFKNERIEPIFKSADDSYLVFEMPDPKHIYVIGVDVGEGIGRAASVAQVLDVTDLSDIRQVAVYGTNLIEPYHFANRLYNLCLSWGKPPLLVERNNCGGQLIDALHYNLLYEKIVCYSKLSDAAAHSHTRQMGVFSHNNIKFAGTANMRYWLNTLQHVKINDITTIKELETFIKFPTGIYRRKSDSFFDDRVMSLIWSLFCLMPDIVPQYFDVAKWDTQGKPCIIESREDMHESDPQFYNIKDLEEGLILMDGVEEFSKEYLHINDPFFTPSNSGSYEYGHSMGTGSAEDLLDAGWTTF